MGLGEKTASRFGSQERAISVRDSRPENELSGVGASLSAIETTSCKKGLTPYSIAERILILQLYVLSKYPL